MTACRAPTTHPAVPARGMAALLVVMVLFFIMAMVAAYTNRNLVFEQRTTANSYRAERSVAAADAGLDWALSQLNGGRIDLECRPSTAAANDDFRRRYLSRSADGSYAAVGPINTADELFPGCVSMNANLTCICPVDGTPRPVVNPVRDWATDGGGSAFRIQRLALGGLVPSPGAMSADVRGCASPGTGDTACVSGSNPPTVDALTAVRATLGLVRALPNPPVATLTAGATISSGAALLNIGNGDAATGLTAHAGGTITTPVASQFQGPAGSADNGRIELDTRLVAPTVAQRFTVNDVFFRGTFGMDPVLYRKQPALRRLNCAAGCTTADVVTLLNDFPQRTLWLDGDLTLDAAPASGVLGSAAEPLMLIVTGTLTVESATEIRGFVYATDIVWSGAAGGALLRGAMVASNTFTASANATLLYDQVVLDTIRLGYGSFVRAPGSWGRPI